MVVIRITASEKLQKQDVVVLSSQYAVSRSRFSGLRHAVRERLAILVLGHDLVRGVRA